TPTAKGPGTKKTGSSGSYAGPPKVTVTGPEFVAVHDHHTDRPGNGHQGKGSSGSAVAPPFEPTIRASPPPKSVRSAKSSLGGVSKNQSWRAMVPESPRIPNGIPPTTI